ncbi:MAG: hypothetical protein R3C53_27950 [Pirellulaceae bacterium]
MFYTISNCESVGSDDVECVLKSLPEQARSTLIDHVGVILADDFRFGDLHYGGPGPSPEERERTRLLYQKRVKTFAALLHDRLNTSEDPVERVRKSSN